MEPWPCFCRPGETWPQRQAAWIEWNRLRQFIFEHPNRLPGETDLEWRRRTKCWAKRAYLSHRDARIARDSMAQNRDVSNLVYYLCDFCHLYHLGRDPRPRWEVRQVEQKREAALWQWCLGCYYRGDLLMAHDTLTDANAATYPRILAA